MLDRTGRQNTLRYLLQALTVTVHSMKQSLNIIKATSRQSSLNRFQKTLSVLGVIEVMCIQRGVPWAAKRQENCIRILNKMEHRERNLVNSLVSEEVNWMLTYHQRQWLDSRRICNKRKALNIHSV